MNRRERRKQGFDKRPTWVEAGEQAAEREGVAAARLGQFAPRKPLASAGGIARGRRVEFGRAS